MHVYIIKASAQSEFKEYKKFMAAPPQSIFSLAASTPSGVKIDMVDETMGMEVNFMSKADLVVIFASTPDIVRGYWIAKYFSEKGKTVVMGGLHVKFMPEEALGYCDSIMIGETEGIWEELLADFSCGRLKPKYKRESLLDLSELKPYPTNIIDKKIFNGFWSVVVSRGCDNKCSYCLVHPFFEGIRYRPIGDVIDEIKKCGAKWIELHADNLTADRDYAMELLTALKPLKINWVGETTIKVADDPEMLKLVAESGLQYLLLGLETPSKVALQGVKKGFMEPSMVKEYISRFHEYGITIDSAMLFGFDEHDSSIFEESLEFVKYTGVDVTHSVIVIPFPGSEFYNKMETENRILTRDWRLYDGRHIVFQPKLMSTEEIMKGTKWFEDNFFAGAGTYRYMKSIGRMFWRAR